MQKFKTTLILSAAALCLSAVPSYAQYGSGTPSNSGGNISQTQSSVNSAKRRAERKARKQLKKQQAALAEKEAMEKELVMKEKENAAYGSGTPAAKPAYGSATPAPAYGSGTPAAQPTYGSATPAPAPAYGSGNAAPAAQLPVNCPTGTQPQNDGTCMLTSGNFPTG